MANAKGLSLRGGAADGAISGRHCRPVQAVEETYTPIASVAALTAQPLAALPPYGCGVPFTWSERRVQRYSTAEVLWSPPHSPDVSLRGPEGAVAISGRHLQFARATEKTHKPIASVAALPERHWQLQILKQFRRPCRFPDLSLRGPEGAVAISCRQLRFRRGSPVIQPGTARFPRRFAPRNAKLEGPAPLDHRRNICNCLRRSPPVKGTPHP